MAPAETGTATTSPTNTATATHPATPTPEAPATDQATATLTATPLRPVEVEQVFPLPWPVDPFRDAQVEEARECAAMMAARGATLDLEEPQTACDWALMAEARIRERVAEALQTATPESGSAARAFHLLPRPAEEAVYAFGQAVVGNPALALAATYNSPPLYAAYLNALPLVEPPPVAEQPITAVDIALEQIDHVPAVQYALHVEGANGDPVVSGQITRWEYGEDGVTETVDEIDGVVSVAQLQGLGGEALSDLLPVDHPFRMGPGTGYAISWQVTLTFADGSTLSPFNQGTMLFAGAPWFIELDGQWYLQYSTDFLDALLAVTGALALPPGNDPALTRHVHWFDGARPLEAGFSR
ncbi:MAG: hypothetical protein R3248_09105 [Candidatus Promineifilaceae bacterium]|nr:hypothetical protein [Candidatus Promineifilaceae bacterium]